VITLARIIIKAGWRLVLLVLIVVLVLVGLVGRKRR
jgi:hypothetical protein